MSVTITADEFKAFFDRGQFIYGDNVPAIRDKDITEAIDEALIVMNQDLYPTEEICTKALYYLSAHFLISDIDAIEGEGQSKFIQQSRSANGVSESLVIPEWMQNGDLAMYVTTYYGQKFLMISKPYLDGAVFASEGATRP